MINQRFCSIIPRYISISITLFYLFSIFFISACNNDLANEDVAGSVSLQVQWPDQGSSKQSATILDDCSSNGVVTIAVRVRDSSGNNLVSDNFDCHLHVGTISVPVGSGRQFIISALDGSGKELYHGEKTATINPGSNDIGIIQLNWSSQPCTDNDRDGYFAENGCGTGIDCNDNNPGIHPNASEICEDGIDQDCDGRDDQCVPVDRDGDGFNENDDCNDNDPNINPDATEICNDEIDNDCDTATDCDDEDCYESEECEGCTDGDSDGYYAESGCGTEVDCDDANPDVNPGAYEGDGEGMYNCEDGIDNDCDGDIDCEDTDCSCGMLEPPFLIDPSPGSTLDNGCDDNSDSITWYFGWSGVEGATQYRIYVIHEGASIPVIDRITTDSYFSYNSIGYIINSNRFNWTWRVSAGDNLGQWSNWSETGYFEVEPLNTDCPE